MAYEVISKEAAVMEGLKKEFSLIYYLSSVYIGSVPKEFEFDGNVIEAHFFDKDEEIRILNLDGEIRAARLSENESDVAIEGMDSLMGGAYILSYFTHLEADEDGQYGITARRLAGLKGV